MSLKSIVVSLLLLLLGSVRASAAGVPVGFNDRKVADGLTSPTTLTILPDGRVLVVQQNGVIRLVQNDTLSPDNFWQVPNVDNDGERGCLGITSDPDFANNHFVYVFCTIASQTSNNQVIRVTEQDGRAVAGSEQVLVTLPPVVKAIWHMGGALRFGTDGNLYIAVGNHEDDPQPAATANSQNLSNPFGKILRIKPDGSVPTDNPFVGMMGAYGAIWSYGYRNPFAFDIQPGTGRMLVGDVGQGTFEEIDDNVQGGNYGWPMAEGPSPNNALKSPLYAWQHDETHCAVTGGAFYNPPTAQFPASYVGQYLFQDFCEGTIKVLDLATNQPRPFVTGIPFPTNLAVAPDGSVYYLSRNQETTQDPTALMPGVASLGKVAYTGSGAPRIAKNPAAQTIFLGDPVTFEVLAEGAEKLQWQRDGVDIDGATQSTYTLAQTQQTDDGAQFRVVATNGQGSTESLAATLTITTNTPPKATITAPVELIQYAPGDTLTFTGAGTDAMDGDLPESAFTWQVDFQHDTHTHPLLAATTGKNTITFKVPDLESDLANTWMRVTVTVKDSAGATNSASRNVFPATLLSTLTPVDPVANGFGPFERDLSNGDDALADGKPLTIQGISFLKGVGVHAPSDLRFDLGAGCTGELIADVGVDDEVGDAGSVIFQVFADDKKIFDSGLKRGTDARAAVAVSVGSAKQLRLVVTDGGDGNGSDHGDWGGVRVTGCPATGATAPTAGSGGSDPAAGSGGTSAPTQTSGGGTPANSGGAGVPASGTGASAADGGWQDLPQAGRTTPGAGGANAPGVKADGGVGTAGSERDGGSAATDAGASPSKGKDDDGGCSMTGAPRPSGRDALWGALFTLACAVQLRRRRR